MNIQATETAYLGRFLELLEKLQSTLYGKHTEKQINILIEQINQHIGSLEKLVDMLRDYESKYGFYNDRTKRAIECASAAQRERGGCGIYGALWFQFAHENVLFALRSWIKEASGSKAGDADKPAETKQNIIYAKIKAFFWKGYEITAKAAFDAILNKQNPS